MRIAFRADASIEIGSGHVMRCLTLADGLRAGGAECVFIGRAFPGNLLDVIQQRGHGVLPLPQPDEAVTDGDMYARWLGVSWQQDAVETAQCLAYSQADWLVVDHYALDARWESQTSVAGRHLMVVDDLANRPHVCDLLLDQNLGRVASDYRGLVPASCSVLAGPTYALLRPEFARLRPASLARRSGAGLKRLLVAMGGVDKDNATGLVLAALAASTLPEDCRISVVMGAQAPWLEQVRAAAAAMPLPTEVLVNVSDMATLMADCDLAIGAAGSTSWERCCLGLPCLMVIIADNQRPGAQALAESGAALLVGESPDISAKLPRILAALLDEGLWSDRQSACAAICDGDGTERIIKHLLTALLSARPVTKADEMLLFEWANDPMTRRNAVNTSPIPLAGHQAWLAGRLATPDRCCMFVVEQGGEGPIGQVRLDRNDAGYWEIDYALAPAARGKGLGGAMLACALAAFWRSHADAVVVAQVKRNNLPSCRVFDSLGFEALAGNQDMAAYHKTLGGLAA